MSILNRLNDIKYMILKTLQSSISDQDKYYIANSLYYNLFKEVGTVDSNILTSISFEGIPIVFESADSYTINGVSQSISNNKNNKDIYKPLPSVLNPGILRIIRDDDYIINMKMDGPNCKFNEGYRYYHSDYYPYNIEITTPPNFIGDKLEIYIDSIPGAGGKSIYTINSGDDNNLWAPVTLLEGVTNEVRINYVIYEGSDYYIYIYDILDHGSIPIGN